MSTRTITAGDIVVEVEPEHGGRIGQITVASTPLLVGRNDSDDSAIAWGAYPMVPWAGRIRHGRFEFRGTTYQLPLNHGDHAMHGVGLTSSWDVVAHEGSRIRLRLDLPSDERWPFGGQVEQTFEVTPDCLTLHMRVGAGALAFPVSFGWHPWFRQPDSLRVDAVAMFRRDADGIAVDELVAVPDRPWDDCFIVRSPIDMTVGGVDLELRSPCEHWVIYDEPAHATCVEPQTGPPDAFTIAPNVIEPGESTETTFSVRFATPRVPDART